MPVEVSRTSGWTCQAYRDAIPYSLRSAFVEPTIISSQCSAARHAATMHDVCMDRRYPQLEYLYSAPCAASWPHVEKVRFAVEACMDVKNVPGVFLTAYFNNLVTRSKYRWAAVLASEGINHNYNRGHLVP